MKISQQVDWGTNEGEIVVPRAWQVRELPIILNHYTKPTPEPAVVFAVTGSGKSILMRQIIASLELDKDEVIVVSTSTIMLVRQLSETIRERLESSEFFTTAKVGCYYTFEKTTDTPIIVTCMPSLPELAEILQLKQKRVHWIADEMHKTNSATTKKAFDLLMPVWALGFSATPYLADRAKTLSLFSKVISRYTAKEALADKCVVGWRSIFWNGSEKTSMSEVAYEMTKDAKFPGMYSALHIKDAEDFAQFMCDKGVPTAAVHSQLPDAENKNRIKMLKSGELKALTYVSMLSEGVDIRQLRFLCLRAPCGSRVRYVQMLGRVLRYYKDPLTGEEKNEAIIYDPLALAEVHSLSHEEALGGEYLEEDNEEDEGKRMERELQQGVFEMLREIVRCKASKDPIPVSPLAGYLTELVNCFDIHGMIERKISARDWRRREASDRQKDAIDRLVGVFGKKTVPTIHQKALRLLAVECKHAMTSGMASDMISIGGALCEKGAKWPDFKNVDTAASEGLEKHEKKKSMIIPSMAKSESKKSSKIQQGLLFDPKAQNPEGISTWRR